VTTRTEQIYELAREAYHCFENAERPDGTSFVRVRDGSPQWVSDLVRAAHGDFLPDDWRYISIRAALGDIADNEPDNLDEYRGEWADSNIDTFNAERSAWLSSDLRRAGYCEDAGEEFDFEVGSGPRGGVFDLIGLGQYAESEEIYDAVITSLRERVEEKEEE
jgi:hypothetical protein